MLFRIPEVDPQEQEVIGRIDEVRMALSYATTAQPWTSILLRLAAARCVQGSDRIGGRMVTIDDAIAVADGEEPVDTPAGSARAALVGYRNAMAYVLQLADDPHISYSRGLIRSLHFMMLQHDLAKHPGRWRPGPLPIRSARTGGRVHEGPDAARINDLMLELVAALNQPAPGVHPVGLAAMAHLNLVMIQPFSDGNGRMGRVLQTLVLACSSGLTPVFSGIEEYLGRHQEAYSEVLTEVGAGGWHPDRDARPWVRFCLTAHFRQASTLVSRARVLQKVWETLERETATLRLPDRTVLVLSEAALGLKVRNASYRRLADISENLAGRDLKALADAGFLVPQGEKRGRVYTASAKLSEVGATAAADEPSSILDPFTSGNH